MSDDHATMYLSDESLKLIYASPIMMIIFGLIWCCRWGCKNRGKMVQIVRTLRTATTVRQEHEPNKQIKATAPSAAAVGCGGDGIGKSENVIRISDVDPKTITTTTYTARVVHTTGLTVNI